jgi:hypothetical protein
VARSEARLLVEIWNDPDFRALSPGAQWTFMFLISQPDLTHDGVIALRETRWSGAAEGLTLTKLIADLDELDAARFIVVDRQEQELLIRSFIRRDKVYRQPNVLRAAADHLLTVTSFDIRLAVATELARIDDAPDGSLATLEEMKAALPNPSDNPSGGVRRREVQDLPGKGEVLRPPLQSTPPRAPDPEEHSVNGAKKRRSRTPHDYDDASFVEFWAVYPNKKSKADAFKAWRAALKAGHEPTLIVNAAMRYRDDPSRNPTYTKHPATWLRGESFTDPEPETARPTGGGWWNN